LKAANAKIYGGNGKKERTGSAGVFWSSEGDCELDVKKIEIKVAVDKSSRL
jgi:hypothetical protein